MTDEQIIMLLRLTGEEAKMLLDQDEYSLYRDIQEQLVGLVREYGVQLPLHCLQFLYAKNENEPTEEWGLESDPPF